MDGSPIENIFAAMDGDDNGSLTAEEIKSFFANKVAEGKKSMQENDKNGDGSIDKDEFKGHPMGFKMYDENEDGKITYAEVNSYFDMRGEQDTASLMEHEDADGNGEVSWSEYGGPKGPPQESGHDEL